MSFTGYAEYEYSGSEYLGEVPAHWKFKRLRFATRINPSKGELGPMPADSIVSFLPMEAISNIGSPDLSAERPLREVQNGYTYFRDGDVAFAKITPCFENGKRALFSNLTNGIGFGTTELIVLRASDQETIPKFLYWLCASSEFMNPAEGGMYGTGGQKRVSEDFVRDFLAPVPSVAEQVHITSFLDSETAKIDALIEEQRRLIELLKEKRQAVISHAVTKGLDPTASMKSSGEQWLGEIPAHWEVLRIGELYREVQEPGNSSLPTLTVSIHTGVSDRQLDADEMERQVARSEDATKYKRCLPGDLTYNMMRAWQGGFGAVTVEGMVSPAYVVARPRSRSSTPFIEQVLRSPMAIEEMRRYSKGVTDFRLRLYWDEFKTIRVTLPPPDEERAILGTVREVRNTAATLTRNMEAAVLLLQERRSALVSAAVTGKIDVRHWAPTEATA